MVLRYIRAALVVLMALTVGRPAFAGDDAAEPDATESKKSDDSKEASKEKDADDSKEPSKEKEDEPKKEKEKEKDTGHGFQFGVRVGFAFGYKMVFRYDRSPFCRSFDPTKTVGDQQKVCGYAPPPGIEVALSWALLDGFEPYIFGRWGLATETETNTKALQLYGVGVRIYTMSDAPLKIYIEPALALETEGGAGNPIYALNSPQYKTDLVFHAAAGPQYDFNRNVGIFLNAGLDVGVLRSINATLLANIGAQVRFP